MNHSMDFGNPGWMHGSHPAMTVPEQMPMQMPMPMPMAGAAMETCGFGCPVPVMAYIGYQPWGEPFDAEAGLRHGTIFPELVKPFTGKDGAFA
ncbi:MAG: spore coat associated protein CotJA [Oscillospiraceae bacterium]|nr:spore coat associated protein CotJA [Oscillospiraceae bacterium]